jgi:hypothetical protein
VPKIQLELQADDPELDPLESRLGSENVIRARPDHFEGDINIVNLLVNLTTVTIPILSMLVSEHIKSKRYIKAKVKGIEVQGESLKNMEAFLNTIASQKTEAAQKETKSAAEAAKVPASKKSAAKKNRSKKK